ncbi:TolC family protein [Pseudoduganella ginsengisoli]|uniref:RND transporter n=1 Tax=Pseudoduganella ginsengisoli TaxID=1462440 RepID=A0A6L6Q819_9BURK|nr:TolC family protein [Pseudoduganella ginsengisoli]MTW05927.1 RND transporter [Pseudoduganella ginsengisoli]
MALHPITRTAIAAAIAAALAGCASVPADGGAGNAAALAAERIGQPAPLSMAAPDDTAHSEIQSLLAQPLTPDSAARIALLNSPSLKASLAELGMTAAETAQAGRLRNPGFSFGRVRGGGESEIDRSVTFDIAGLLTMPVRSGIARRQLERAQFAAAGQAVQLVFETRRAWYTAVAAAQSAAFAEQVRQAAEAGALLADRMRKSGNWSRLDQARERAFYDDAITRQARTAHDALAAREQLARLLGLEHSEGLQLPERLPDLPAAAQEPQHAERDALEHRLDVLAARREAESVAANLGLTKATRFINVFDVGYASKSTTGMPRQNGYEVSLELPLFDWGGANVARAEALYLQAVHRTADAAVKARSDVRVAYSSYRTAYDIARHYRDHVVPQRKKISDEVLLRYNGMLASVFELLADAREQRNSVNESIEAQRDFWIADTQLQAAQHGAGAQP